MLTLSCSNICNFNVIFANIWFDKRFACVSWVVINIKKSRSSSFFKLINSIPSWILYKFKIPIVRQIILVLRFNSRLLHTHHSRCCLISIGKTTLLKIIFGIWTRIQIFRINWIYKDKLILWLSRLSIIICVCRFKLRILLRFRWCWLWLWFGILFFI